MKRISPPAWAILERMHRSPVTMAEWKTFDQRYLRGLYISDLFYFDRQYAARLTTDGVALVKMQVRKRKDVTRPVFTQNLRPRLLKVG